VNAFNASCIRKHRCLTHVVERVRNDEGWMWSLEGSGDREGFVLQPLQRRHRVGEGQRGVAVVGRQRKPAVDVLLVGGWDLRGFARGDQLVREREQRAVEGLVVSFVRDVGPVYMKAENLPLARWQARFLNRESTSIVSYTADGTWGCTMDLSRPLHKSSPFVSTATEVTDEDHHRFIESGSSNGTDADCNCTPLNWSGRQ